MNPLKGKISDRIRSGKLPKDVKVNYERGTDPPATSSVRHGSGQGLGQGATRARGTGNA
jgi:hypothetical protein